MWSRLGEAFFLESWYGACHSISSLPPGIGSFPTAVLLWSWHGAELQLAQSGHVMWTRTTLCFSLPLLGCCCKYKLPVLIQGIFVTAHLSHTLQQSYQRWMDIFHLPHSFPPFPQTLMDSSISPPLHSDNVQFAELQVIMNPAPQSTKGRLEASVENVLVSSDVVKWGRLFR